MGFGPCQKIATQALSIKSFTCQEECSGDGSRKVLPDRSQSSRWGCVVAQGPHGARADSPAEWMGIRGSRQPCRLTSKQLTKCFKLKVTLWNGIPLIAPFTPALQTQVGTSTPESWILPPVLLNNIKWILPFLTSALAHGRHSLAQCRLQR